MDLEDFGTGESKIRRVGWQARNSSAGPDNAVMR